MRSIPIKKERDMVKQLRVFTAVAAMLSLLWVAKASAQPWQHKESEVEIRGKELLRDGRPWIPHGFYQIAFEVAPANLSRADHPFWTTAQEDYRPEEYTGMRAAGADTVRIQIAQAGADPKSPIFDRAFLNKALDAVRAARRAGLTVIVCVQGESHVPHVPPLDLPGPGTRRVWEKIAREFADDRGVLFELLNEPKPVPNPENWMKWKEAMTETAQTVRKTGARNVIIADGLESGQVLDGAPLLNDSQVAYASHPYADQKSGQYGQTRDAWEKKFGSFARRAPVIITEWHFGGYFCDADTPRATLNFLHYIEERHIGVVVGTWDWPPAGFGNARWDFPKAKFSSFSGLSCHQPGYGLGRVIEHWYTTGHIPEAPE
jgi:endoglucanase